MKNNTLKNNNFIWLLYWFWSQTDGHWEHSYGITLCTISKDRWLINIDFLESGLDITKLDFFDIKINKLVKECSSNDLIEIIAKLRILSEPNLRLNYIVDKIKLNDEALSNLLEWYKNAVNDNQIQIEIGTLDNPGWILDIKIVNSDYNNINTHKLEQFNSDNNWISASFESGQFTCSCGPFNLIQAMEYFLSVIKKNNCELVV